MTHELVLTSVSQGLKEDERGFCVVACDQSVPDAIIPRLYSLSEYRHVFPPESEENTKNPVVYSHILLASVPESWHILSRISDSGIDYQHKPNHLAHHILLSTAELTEEGPAWLLALPNFHFEEWLTPAVGFPMGRPISTLTGHHFSSRH
ncbi:MAG: hypothetical protein ACRCUY_02225, partial [Thermoguttaceae bacterium]